MASKFFFTFLLSFGVFLLMCVLIASVGNDKHKNLSVFCSWLSDASFLGLFVSAIFWIWT